MDWNCKVLITGGTGFIGAHLVEQLLNLGADLYLTYRDLNPNSYFFQQQFQDRVKLLHCDVKNYNRILEIISKQQPEYIFHLAAQTSYLSATVNPLECLYTNILGTVNVLESVRHNPNPSVLIFSTDKSYGTAEYLPYDEMHRLEGRFPYDVSKSSADLITSMYNNTYGLYTITVRPVNIFGPGDFNFFRIVPETLRAIVNQTTINIRGDGQTKREYIYVKDVADACVKLMERLDIGGEAFNIGSDVVRTTDQIVQDIFLALGERTNIVYLNAEKDNVIREQCADSNKIWERIGWRPSYTFEKAIQETYPWYEKYYKVKK